MKPFFAFPLERFGLARKGGRRRGARGDLGRRASFTATLSFACVAAFSPATAAPLDHGLFAPLQGASVAVSRPEPSRRRLSKYEARKTRHTCAARAAERGLSGAERDNYVAGCYANRLAHRGDRLRCRQEAAAKGIDKSALRDFLRDCVRDHSRE